MDTKTKKLIADLITPSLSHKIKLSKITGILYFLVYGNGGKLFLYSRHQLWMLAFPKVFVQLPVVSKGLGKKSSVFAVYLISER